MSKPRAHYGKWRIRWVDQNGTRHSQVFDQKKAAEIALLEKRAMVHRLEMGLAEAAVQTHPFTAICEYWLTYRNPQKKNPKDDALMIRTHLLPFFGTMTLNRIGAADVDRYKQTKTHLAPHTVANHLTLLISLLNAAKDLGWIDKTPTTKKPKVRLNAKDFRYLRTKEEIGRFLDAAKAQEGQATFTLYATAVYTGMRAGEIAGLQWDDVDLDRRLITVKRSFNSSTKSGCIRYVPILDALLPILQSWQLVPHNHLVFPNQAGHMQINGARVFDEVLKRTLKTAGLADLMVAGKLRAYIRFHDLRHTFASHWMMCGGDMFKLQKILGHQSTEMTMRYSHLSPSAFTEDLNRLPSYAISSTPALAIVR